MATFDDLTLSRVGEGYTLIASSGSLPTTSSNAFNVSLPTLRLFVSDYRNQVDSSIDVFSAAGLGDVGPVRSVSGSSTELRFPAALSLDQNTLFVANQRFDGGNPLPGRIDVFSTSASGNVAPLRSIQGTSTSLARPSGIVTVGDFIFVANQGSSPSILVFPRTASGNVNPVRTIQGENTLLAGPTQLASDGTNLYVADQTADSTTEGALLVFPLSAQGNVTPSRVLRGINTRLNGPFGVAVSETELFITDARGDDEIKVFSLDASGDTAPLRALQVSARYGRLALQGQEIYLADGLNPRISVYDSQQSGAVSPLRTLAGSATGLDKPRGIAVGVAP